MRRILLCVVLSLPAASPAAAQSLFVLTGERAVEGSVAWSVGPFSNGIETLAALSLDGRWDVGFGVNRYAADFGGPDDTTLIEWTPFARYFIFKEDDDAVPLSLAVHAQYFRDHVDGQANGWYVLAGGQLFKKFVLTDGFALHPYVGFALAGESSPLGGDTSERSVYLTRQFGVHGQLTLTDDAWLRVTVEEHAFRRETYRAVRAAYVVRF